MEANLITLARIVLSFVVAALFEQRHPGTDIAATLLVVGVIYLDAVDGIVARKLNIASDLGALFDIVGDRIVEAVFWIYFASRGVIPFWIPMIVIARGFLTDSIRTVAFGKGQTPFGAKTMMKSPVTRFLVASRFSRGFYGVLKVVLFFYLGGLLFLSTALPVYHWAGVALVVPLLQKAGLILAWFTLGLCLLRGIPVFIDGKDVLFGKVYPKVVRNEPAA